MKSPEAGGAEWPEVRLYQARHWSGSSGKAWPVKSRSASKTQLRVMASRWGSVASRTRSGTRCRIFGLCIELAKGYPRDVHRRA